MSAECTVHRMHPSQTWQVSRENSPLVPCELICRFVLPAIEAEVANIVCLSACEAPFENCFWENVVKL